MKTASAGTSVAAASEQMRRPLDGEIFRAGSSGGRAWEAELPQLRRLTASSLRPRPTAWCHRHGGAPPSRRRTSGALSFTAIALLYCDYPGSNGLYYQLEKVFYHFW
jgi:hypothetical protein